MGATRRTWIIALTAGVLATSVAGHAPAQNRPWRSELPFREMSGRLAAAWLWSRCSSSMRALKAGSCQGILVTPSQGMTGGRATRLAMSMSIGSIGCCGGGHDTRGCGLRVAEN